MKSKFMNILLAAALAFSMWCFVVLVEQPESEETYYDIPVSLQNEDILTEQGLMLVCERPTVTLRLASTRTNLNNLNESNINVLANLASISSPGTHSITYSLSFPGNVPQSAVNVQSQSTEMVTVKVEKRITKQVPVVPQYTGSVPEGMIAHKENAILDVPSVEVSGPESVLANITQAVIYVDLNDQSQNIVGDYTYALCDDASEPVDSQWVTTNVEQINLTLKIQQVKEIALTVEVIAGGGATAATSSIDIQPRTIRVSGSEAVLNDLDQLQLGTINLAELATDTELTFPIVLPEGVTNETGITEATVEVKFPNLRTKVLKVANIEAVNVPEGMEVDMITQELEIRIRGPVALVDSMTVEDITLRVDFTDAELGTDTKRATVILGEGFEGVGAIGTYSVSVTVKEASEEGN